MFCTKCGSQLSGQAEFCGSCGTRKPANAKAKTEPTPYGGQQSPSKNLYADKSRITAAVLALLVGGLGIHKFYLGKIWPGVVYVLLCWTYVPAVVALVEAIIYFTQNDETFATKQAATKF